MKFGKTLLEASTKHLPLCPASYWLNYKQLKKLTHDLERFRHEESEGEISVGQKTKIRTPVERRFFLFLHRELLKVSGHFSAMQTSSLDKLRWIVGASLPNGVMLEEIKNLHARLMLLKGFADLNYVGFRKILKRHDKVTGFQTRDKYMTKLVDGTVLAEQHHQWISQTLTYLEELFQTILMQTNQPLQPTPSNIPIQTVLHQISDIHRNQNTSSPSLANALSRNSYLNSFSQHHHEFLLMQQNVNKRTKRESSRTNARKEIFQKDNSKLDLESLMVAAEMVSNFKN
eukprot:maker-scaffold_18-snap-gene-2.62-mRNA-1 protein AED:0.01 eAED:0.01 QI:204/1/1/1/1/1/3/152/286